MASNYSRWYRTGSVTVTKNSKNVTGDGTFWLSALLHAGDTFTLDGVHDYEVDAITDNTHLTLKTAYLEATQTGAAYAINRNWSASMPSEIAAKTSELLGDFIRYIDEEQKTIFGKSAYEVACDNGYTGTESQWVSSLKGENAYELARASGFSGTQAEWLESLKAAGEWADHDGKISGLEDLTSTWNSKNMLWSGKNLGSAPTAEQYAAIADGSFSGLGIGDYWENGGRIYRIAHFNYYSRMTTFSGDLNNYGATDPATGQKRLTNWSKSSGQTWMPPHIVVLSDTAYPIGGPIYTSEQVANDEVSYFQSQWYTGKRAEQLESLKTIFGDEHLLEWIDNFVTSYDSAGRPSGYLQAWGRFDLMTYTQLLGKPAYDAARPTELCGEPGSNLFSNGQFAVNRLGQWSRSMYVKGKLRDMSRAGGSGTTLYTHGCGRRGSTTRSAVDTDQYEYYVRAYFVLG